MQEARVRQDENSCCEDIWVCRGKCQKSDITKTAIPRFSVTFQFIKLHLICKGKGSCNSEYSINSLLPLQKSKPHIVFKLQCATLVHKTFSVLTPKKWSILYFS